MMDEGRCEKRHPHAMPRTVEVLPCRAGRLNHGSCLWFSIGVSRASPNEGSRCCLPPAMKWEEPARHMLRAAGRPGSLCCLLPVMKGSIWGGEPRTCCAMHMLSAGVVACLQQCGSMWGVEPAMNMLRAAAAAVWLRLFISGALCPFVWVALLRPERPLCPPSHAGRQAQGQDGRHAHKCARRRPNSLYRCLEGGHFSVLLSA